MEINGGDKKSLSMIVIYLSLRERVNSVFVTNFIYKVTD